MSVHYFRLMKELALLGYFTSEIGYCQAMRYVETPRRYGPRAPRVDSELEALTLILGRRPRRDRGVPRKPTSRLLREPAYLRVGPEEVRRYLRLRRNGRSLRWIARHQHHCQVVRRWLHVHHYAAGAFAVSEHVEVEDDEHQSQEDRHPAGTTPAPQLRPSTTAS